MFQVFNVLISNFDRLKVQCVEVWSLLCTHTKTSISSLSAHEQNGQLDRNLSFYLERNCQRLYSPQGNWTRTNMLLIKGFKVSRSCQNFYKKNKYGPRNQTREGWLLRPTQSKPPMPLWLAVAGCGRLTPAPKKIRKFRVPQLLSTLASWLLHFMSITWII